MLSSRSIEKINICVLSEKLRQIKIMKWILNYKSDEEYTYEDLYKQIDFLCRENFAHLVVINHYLTQIPQSMNIQINKILLAKNNFEQCKGLYFDFLKNFHKIPEFNEYYMYIVANRSENLLSNFQDINSVKDVHSIENIEAEILKQKFQQTILIFTILKNNDKNMFVKGDIIHNLPQIIYWIKQNKNKPIEQLSNDDCEIITGLIYNLSFEEMLNKLNLSPNVTNYNDIDEIIDGLPQKFHVQNLTQVVFRILLLKPYIWRQSTHENIVKAIKGIHITGS